MLSLITHEVASRAAAFAQESSQFAFRMLDLRTAAANNQPRFRNLINELEIADELGWV